MPPICRASLQDADGPEPTRWVLRHEPFSVRAEKYADETVDRQFGHLRGIAQTPDLRAVLAVATGRQPLAVRADSHDFGNRPADQAVTYHSESRHGRG